MHTSKDLACKLVNFGGDTLRASRLTGLLAQTNTGKN